MRSKNCPKDQGHLQCRTPYEIEKMKYCPCCGAKLEIRKCEKCRAEMDNDWIYCTKCGHGDSKRIQARMLKQLNKEPKACFINLVDAAKYLQERSEL